jgi:hypothetical protein
MGLLPVFYCKAGGHYWLIDNSDMDIPDVVEAEAPPTREDREWILKHRSAVCPEHVEES